MADRAFSSFVILAGMRTGSNLLEAQVNAMAGLHSHGELFNPHFIGKRDHDTYLGVRLKDRDAAPERLWDVVRQSTEGLPGCRYFHDHDPRMFAVFLDDSACAKIVLTRNPLESYVSWKIAQATGQWKLTQVARQKSARATFDGAEFAAFAETAQAFHLKIQTALQRRGQTAFYIDYDDLADLEVLNGLAAHLGADGRLEALEQTLKKQNPGSVADLVANPEAIQPALARLDRFNLARTPSFEPRRPPAVPSFVATVQAGLLYMPIRGGPEARVRAWLQSIDPSGLVEDFSQKSLRQWLQDHRRHCAFTVVSHPLLRAWRAFRHQVMPGHAKEARAILGRSGEVLLPDPGMGFGSAGDERRAFLGFLRFVQHNLAAQAGSRVNAHWASQSAVLTGFAQWRSPSLILHEDRLAEGLRFAAQEAGLDGWTDPPDAATDDVTSLAAIFDPTLEAASRAAYARDYTTYGFGDWTSG